MVIHLGNNQHDEKTGQGNSALSCHKVGRLPPQHLSIIGTGAVDHNQTKHSQENNDKEQTEIIKSAYLFLLGHTGHSLPPILSAPEVRGC